MLSAAHVICQNSRWLLEWAEVPERTRPAGAFGDGLPVKAEALQTLGFDGAPRRTFSRPGSNEMTFGRLRGRRQLSGPFGGDFFAEGSSLRFCRSHFEPPVAGSGVADVSAVSVPRSACARIYRRKS